jgi:predicted metal-dependent hydrolase
MGNGIGLDVLTIGDRPQSLHNSLQDSVQKQQRHYRRKNSVGARRLLWRAQVIPARSMTRSSLGGELAQRLQTSSSQASKASGRNH